MVTSMERGATIIEIAERRPDAFGTPSTFAGSSQFFT